MTFELIDILCLVLAFGIGGRFGLWAGYHLGCAAKAAEYEGYL